MVETVDGLQLASNIILFSLEMKIIDGRVVEVMCAEHFQPFIRLVRSVYILNLSLVVRLAGS